MSKKTIFTLKREAICYYMALEITDLLIHTV